MELHERIAAIRKTKGLTQEQLGELVGVTRQAVSKWESGQAVPDALTIARLCQELNLSADYVLLGKETEPLRENSIGRVRIELEETDPAYQMPDSCPCCGRNVSGTLCPACGYPLPMHPYRGPRYAVVVSHYSTGSERSRAEELVKYCGFSSEDADTAVKYLRGYDAKILVRRDLTDSAAHWITKYLNRMDSKLKIVEDLGEPEEKLLEKESAMDLPPSENDAGMSCSGCLGIAVIVIFALLILSIF